MFQTAFIFGTCADPDYSKPLPGDVIWTTRHPVILRPPQPLFADPWARKAIAPCQRKRTLPPIQVFDGTNPYPRVF